MCNTLVESGNAIQTQEPASKYIGALKTGFHLTHPKNCLVVDVVGTDSSQKGHINVISLLSVSTYVRTVLVSICDPKLVRTEST